MAEPYATLQDYIDDTGTNPTGAQAVKVSRKLVGASAIIRSKLPDGYTPDAELARTICLQMVERAITNPGGRRSRQMGRYQETFDQDGGLYIADSEEQTLLAAWRAEEESGAYTVPLRDEAYPACPPPRRRW